MYSEEDLLPLSALQHLAYCERQWALIHIEQQWAENQLTAEGRLQHQRVHEKQTDSYGEVRIARGLRLRSLRLGITGSADIVEFHRHVDGAEVPFPVEYKHGRPKHSSMDEVQLCAQAMCLEEMIGARIPAGALFYGTTRRRTSVEFTESLRNETERLCQRLHVLQRENRTPAPEYGPKCDRCSLFNVCAPKALQRSAKAYLRRSIAACME